MSAEDDQARSGPIRLPLVVAITRDVLLLAGEPAADAPAGTSLKIKDVFAVGRDAAVIAGIVLFAIGYVYRYAYMRDLGIPVHASDSSVNEIIVFAATVVERQIGWFALFAAILAAVISAIEIACRAGIVNAPSRDRLLVAVMIVASLGLVWIGQLLAQSTAGATAIEVRSGHIIPSALFAFAPCRSDKRCVPDEVRTQLDPSNNVLVIVEETPDVYFVVRSYVDPVSHEVQPEFSTYRIPKESVAVVRAFGFGKTTK